MTTVDDLFDRFRAAYLAGEDADPRRFLTQVTGSDRRELAALIDAFLVRAPDPPFDEARAKASPITQRVLAGLMPEGRGWETWTTLLPQAEAAAGLERATVVARLADALGVAGKREKVHRRYHQMEHGRLDPRRVRPAVLEALSRILDVPIERLQEAGRRMAPPAPPGQPASVFARSKAAAPAPAPAPAAAAMQPPEPWDEVDDLFQGG